MKFTICIIILILNIGIINAQEEFNFSAYILNEATMAAVEFGTIVYVTQDSSFVEGVTSDFNGFFQFKNLPDPNALLIIKHINYCDTILKLTELRSNEQKSILLRLKEFELDEVIIKEKRTLSRNSLSKIEFVVTDNIKNESVLATDVIDKIPIAYVDFNNNIWINGSSKVLVQVNGINMPDAILTNQISPNRIKKIEVITSLPAKYANKDYTAIVNIIADRSGIKGGSLNCKISPLNNFYDINPGVNYTIKNHSFYSIYKYYYRNYEELSKINYTNDSINTALELLTYPRKEMDNEFFYGYFYEGNQNFVFGIDGYTSLYKENFQTKLKEEEYTDFSKFKESFDTYNFQSYFKKQDSTFMLDVNLNWNLKSLSDRNILDYEQSEENRTGKVNKAGGWVDISKNYKQLITSLGFEYYRIEASEMYESLSTATLSQEYNEDRFSSYLDMSLENENRGFSIGLNLYYYNRKFQDSNLQIEDAYWSPTFSYIEKINSKNVLKLSISSNLQNPTLWNMISMPVVINPMMTYSGNPFLKPEIERSISLKHSYSHKRTYLEFGSFFRIMENSIQQNFVYSDSNTVLLTNSNIDKTYEYGFSQTTNFSISSWWKIKLYSEIYQQEFPENKPDYETKHIAWNTTISSYWTLSPKLFVGLRYAYNSSLLMHKGLYKPYNTSLFMARYKISKSINFSLMIIQPFSNFQTNTYVENGYYQIEKNNQIKVRTLVFSLYVNLSKNSNKQSNKLYYNEDKKY
ncbi:MAG: outer membrane beta-barrel protein [Bacteroidales bacterium]|nr:outer membrane beta-barrel protein [Bacteroidales bacterium]